MTCQSDKSRILLKIQKQTEYFLYKMITNVRNPARKKSRIIYRPKARWPTLILTTMQRTLT